MRKISRVFFSMLILAAVIGVAGTGAACAQSVGPSGCVALCGSGGSSSGGGRTTVWPSVQQTPPSHIANNRGVRLAAEGKLLPAIEAYREALRLDPSNHIARENLSNALRRLGSRLLDQDDLYRAEEAYREALAYDPNHAGALNGLGIVNNRRKNYPAALDYYRRAIAADPGAQYARDNLHSLEDWLRREEERIRRNAELDRYYDLRERAGHLRGQAAVDLLLEAVRLKPDEDITWYLLAINQRIAGHFSEAEASLREAARLGWDMDLDAQIRKTRFQRDSQEVASFRPERRIDAYRAMIGTYPEREAEIRYLIAELLAETGSRRDEVDEYLNILTNPDIPENDRNRAHNALIEAGRSAEYDDDDEAERIYRGFLAAGIGGSAIEYRLADAVLRQGRRDEAFDLFRRAAANNRHSHFLHHNFALMLEDAGEYQEAERMARRAVEIDPDNEDSRRMLARLEGHNTSVLRHLDGVERAMKEVDKVFTAIGETAPARKTAAMLERGVDAIDEWVGALEKKFGWESDHPSAMKPPVEQLPQGVREAMRLMEEAERRGEIPRRRPPSSDRTTEPATAVSPIKREAVLRPATVVPEPEVLAEAYGSTETKTWPDLPEPAVRLSKEGIVYAQETWKRAKVETWNAIETESLAWVASKIRHGTSLKSALEKGKEVYKDYSKPVIDLYRHDMEGIRRGISQTDDEEYDERTRRKGEAIIDMSRDVTNKSVGWHTSGGLFGDPDEEPESLKDKAVAYLKKVFDFDEDKFTDLEKWFPPEE